MTHVLSVARALGRLSEDERRLAIGFARELAGRKVEAKPRKKRRTKEELALAKAGVSVAPKSRKHPVSENVEEK